MLSLLLGSLATVSFARPFTGSYIANQRPHWLAFLSITQTDQHVRGFLTTTKPNSRGGTESETVAVEGITDGDAVTLESKTLFNLSNVTLTGRISGNTLMLSFPTSSGDLATVSFRRASEDTFNQVLATWRQELKLAYDQRRRREAAAAERQQKINDARESARRLAALAGELESSNAQILKRAQYQTAVAACGGAFEQMQALEPRFFQEHGEYKCSNLGYRLSDARYRQEDIKYRRGDLGYRIDDINNDEENLQQIQAALKAQLSMFLAAAQRDPSGTITPNQSTQVAYEVSKLLEQTSEVLARVHAANNQARKACDAEIAKAARLYEHFVSIVTQQGCNEER